MFTLNGALLRTKIIIYFIVYCYFIFASHSRKFVKNAPINIAMLIFTNILEMHCLKVANMYEHKYQYLGY